MVDTIYFTLRKRNLTKSDLAILDILAHYQWDRPLYIVSPGGDGDLGYTDYLQFDGFAYRFVPIKTPRNPNDLDAGRVDTDVLYDNLMNKYHWRNINNPSIYVDHNMLRTVVQVLRIRDMFSKLAAELIKEGKMDKALKVQEKGMELIPISMYAPEHMPYSMTTIVENYYKLGKTDKANKLAEELLERNVKNMTFFFKLAPQYGNTLGMEKQLGMQSLYMVSEVVKHYNQPALFKKYEAALNQFYPMFASSYHEQGAAPDSLYDDQE